MPRFRQKIAPGRIFAKQMLYRVALAMIIGAWMMLPVFGYASLEEKGMKMGNSIGASVSLFLSGIGSTVDESVNIITSVAGNMYHGTSRTIQRQHSMLSLSAKTLMAKAESNLREQIAGIHRMLLESAAGTARNTLNGVFATNLDIVKHLVSDTLSALSPSPTFDVEEESVRSADNRNTSNVEREVRTVHPAATRYVENNEGQTVKIIERIIVKEPRATSELANSNSSLLASGYTLNPYQDPRINTLITNVADLTTRIDEQRGNLPANLAGAYSNSALFNMIASFQRIKTLDDVKITNATIEGYASSASVSASFLALTGGTLTGSLIGTTISLSSTLNASSTAHITGLTTLGNNLTFSASSATTTIPAALRNAFALATSSAPTPFLSFDTNNYRIGIGSSSPAQTFSLHGSHYLTGGLGVGNATTTTGVLETSGLTYFGGLLKGASDFTFAGTGTSTITGRLAITASSSMAGYRLCSQFNDICSPFTDTGSNVTLRTSTNFLGLGTSTPAEKLSINGGVLFDSDIIRYGSSSQPTLLFKYAASSTSTIPNLTSAFTFATSTTNTPLLTLSTKSSRYGRVGIGTSSPSALFAINALNSSNQADNIFYIGSSTQNTFVIDNHGNIGIGTSTRSTSKARLAITGFGTGTNRILALADANNVERFTVQEDGNVGIGTTGPEEKLSVAGNIAFSGSGTVYELRSNSADGSDNKYLAISSTGTAGAARGSYIELRGNEFANNVGMLHLGAGNVGSTGTEGFITFTTGADLTRMVIDRSGNVGIGTTSPQARLHVSQGGVNPSLILSTSGNTSNETGGLEFRKLDGTVTANFWKAAGASDPLRIKSLHNIQFHTNNVAYDASAPQMTIDTAGNVGIGTTTPASTLSVKQGADTKLGGLMLEASDGDTRSMYMNTSGVLSFGGGDSSTGSFNTATLSAAGAWANASDIAYKENIADIAYGLDALMKLQPRFYTMKGSTQPQIGFIAQELEKIIPEVVEGKEGSKGISYGNLAAAVVKAIQELNIKVEDLAQNTAWTSDSSGPGFSLFSLIDMLKQLGIYLEQGIVRATEFVADKITVKKLCLEDVCVTRDQLKELLDKNQVSNLSMESPPPVPPPLLSEPTPESEPESSSS